jgi:hypothetical protein
VLRLQEGHGRDPSRAPGGTGAAEIAWPVPIQGVGSQAPSPGNTLARPQSAHFTYVMNDPPNSL